MKGTFLRSLLSAQEGAVAPIYAIALFALVGIGGIAFDYGRLIAMDTELQNAADQAALAAVTQLDREDGAIGRAISAAQGGLVSNETLFANDGGARGVAVPTVTFYSTRADAEADVHGYSDPDDTDLDATAAFVRVTVATRTANYALTPVVGAFSGTISAEAVAGMGSALCRSPPVMICNPGEPEGNTNEAYDFNADAYEGVGLLVVQGGGGSWTPGNFGYLDTGGAGGAKGVRQTLGWISPPGNCVSQEGNDTVVDTEPGNMASVPDALNTRFDVYDDGCETGGSCPAAINSMKDLLHPADFTDTNACKVHNKGWQEGGVLYAPASTTATYTGTPTAMGHPRDICHAVKSNVTGACTGPFGDGKWDRDTYFRTHYLRTANGSRGLSGTRWTAADWQANTGLSASATRYQVYDWETQHRDQVVDGVTVLGSYTTGSLTKYGKPQCSSRKGFGTGTVPAEGVADRRRISVAVVNCRVEEVNGNSTDVPVRRWMDVFLVQPSIARSRKNSDPGRSTAKDEIYVEIIGETTSGSSGETAGQVVRRDVPYLIR